MPDILMSTARAYSRPKDFIFSLSDDIDKNSFEKLIKAYNDLEEGDTVSIYLNSPGGDPGYAEAIIDAINENCDRTFLIAHGDICSAAFTIFYHSICERKILPGTSGMAHFVRVPIVIVKDDKSLNEWSEYSRKWSKEDFKKQVDFFSSIGFSKAEIKMLQNNKDVYFNETRLRTFLKNHIKLINAGYY